ncbi:DUF2937 family protein [Roseobacter sp. YSTF-M11]|uniref:DUF2937 family protein n=1 Tax=Roseobacter insulae TaxID=2859783 RepID=A0A9X1FU51_9RHOB|nr:DUF2937 family protein [Roseobacter insulae]MBW4707576.1 DUF2937 family protein [Roseobacter insulae]
MILRTVALTAGLAGAFAAAQFPAYSQQYLQRLGGAVDALEQVVVDFDTSAAAEGLSRQQALTQMRGTAFVERRRSDMTRTLNRYETLRADFEALQGQGPFMRAYHLRRLSDAEIARGAWQAFQPAFPLTMATMLFAIAGFVATSFLSGLILAVLRWPARRKPKLA